ncbi:MAG: hypothetical protein KJ645_04760 [Planctomycetes bacterium]|nr:hypothetical protein [Planctomycetota bacterium]
MFALGILGVLQIAFLPGFLLCLILKIRRYLPNLILSFGLSMTTNYFLVLFLVLTGWYTPLAVRGILLVEAALVLIIIYRGPGARLQVSIPRIRLHRIEDTGGPLYGWVRRFGTMVLAVSCIMALGWYLWQVVIQAGSIFTSWDAVSSWNHWAVSWYEQHPPRKADYYPQLIPMNWSLVYKMMGSTEVEYFSKAVMPLFALFILFMMLDLYIKTMDLGYIIGLPLAALFLYKLYYTERHTNILVAGYADMPVAFFSFLAFYALMCAAKDPGTVRETRKYLWIGALAAAAAGLTKQAGLYACLMYPLFSYLLVLRNIPGHRCRDTARTIFLLGLVLLALAATWYACIQVRIWQGASHSNVAYLTEGIHKGRSFAERLVNAWGLLSKNVQRYSPIVPVFMAIALARPLGRAAILMALPYVTLWALLFSYDLRNLCLAVPFIALACGTGMHVVLGLIGRFVPIPPQRQKIEWVGRAGPHGFLLLTVLVIGLFLLNLAFPAALMKESHQEKQRLVGNPYLNRELYEHFDAHPPSGKILTHYYPLHDLPKLREYYVLGNFKQYDRYAADKVRSGIHYLLFLSGGRTDPRILDDVTEGIARGTYKLLFEMQQWCLLEIINKEP